MVHCSHLCPGTLCIVHVIAEPAKVNLSRVECCRKGFKLKHCPHKPKCIFLKKYAPKVWR
jgi:hypothetical protein